MPESNTSAPRRPASASTTRLRPRADDQLVDQLTRSVTPRDRALCQLLFDHRVLTTDQIADALFDSRTRAASRLVALYRKRAVDRFRPYTPTGSAPFHYLLDERGAQLVAAAHGTDPAALGWRKDHAARYLTSQRLTHLVGTNSVFTALLGYARTHPGHQLAAWWPERSCASAFGQLARPDGYGLWHACGRSLDFALEYDTGTEPLTRLTGKLPGYGRLAAALDRPLWLLFQLPTPAREAAARRALTAPPLPVATTHLAAGHPAEPVWLPLGRGTRRASLTDLPETH